MGVGKVYVLEMMTRVKKIFLKEHQGFKEAHLEGTVVRRGTYITSTISK